MSTRFLPISCTSPFTVAITIVPFWPRSFFSISGSRYATADFITSADWSTKGSCICPEPKRSPTTFIPSSKIELMISKGEYCLSASTRSEFIPTLFPSMIRFFNRSSIVPLTTIDSFSSFFLPAKCAINSVNGSKTSLLFSPSPSKRRSSNTSCRASSRPFSSILYSGSILEACTIAISSPASMA